MRDLYNKSREVRRQKSEYGTTDQSNIFFVQYPCSWIPTSVFFILAALFWLPSTVICAENPSPYAIESLTGQTAPDFTLKDLDGKSVTLSSYKGKVVILVFWAAWCPPCKEELQSLNKLYSMYKNRGLVILAVSSDKSLSTVKDFIAHNPVNYSVLFDEKLAVARDLYKAFMVPTTFVIERRGNIFKKHFGEQDWTKPALVKEIDALL